MAALATVSELQGRLDFDLTDAGDEGRDLTPIAQAALEDLSEDVRFYGRQAWPTPDSAPALVKSIVLRAASRHMKNVDGFTQSRAGDETVEWYDDKSGMGGSAHLSDAEIEQVKNIAKGDASLP